MKITITERVPVKKEVDIEFPYYYSIDNYWDMGSSIEYGRVTENEEISILKMEFGGGGIKYEIEEIKGINHNFDPEHKSTESEFNQVLLLAIEHLESFKQIR